ncbi:hypothetical protein N9A08_02875 [Arthrobacter koreensis]|uniref:Uncharacterized protein n=1 Tax=Arthrobacter koreensis TaxID=199136 RepID=A0ABY6FU56_9MICC|nr:hypothetical protein [Arthrobacter koreensis]UYB36645.1 hypothetical protein N9A08_02875 [Arthrobacter koreensis]
MPVHGNREQRIEGAGRNQEQDAAQQDAADPRCRPDIAHSCCERFAKLLAVLGALRCAAPEEDGQRCTEEGQRVESEDEGRAGGRDQHTAERRAHGAGRVDCNGPEC